MSLSFTSIVDQHGPAVYIVHKGDVRSEQQATALGEELDKKTGGKTQIVCLDARRGDGLRVKEFYGLRHLPSTLIILDNDTVPHQWEYRLPRADDIAYTLNHIGGAMRRS